MNDLEERLDPERFVRAHRSAIVNVERVREVQAVARGDRLLILAGGARVRLSRARREAFESRLGRFAARDDRPAADRA
jgi:two-component system LytT family response regulator